MQLKQHEITSLGLTKFDSLFEKCNLRIHEALPEDATYDEIGAWYLTALSTWDCYSWVHPVLQRLHEDAKSVYADRPWMVGIDMKAGELELLECYWEKRDRVIAWMEKILHGFINLMHRTDGKREAEAWVAVSRKVQPDVWTRECVDYIFERTK